MAFNLEAPGQEIIRHSVDSECRGAQKPAVKNLPSYPKDKVPQDQNINKFFGANHLQMSWFS